MAQSSIPMAQKTSVQERERHGQQWRVCTGSNSITTNVDVLLVDTTGANGDQFIKEVSGLTG